MKHFQGILFRCHQSHSRLQLVRVLDCLWRWWMQDGLHTVRPCTGPCFDRILGHNHGVLGICLIEHWLGPALPEARFSAIDLWSGQPLPEDCSGFDAFVVSGSKAGVYEDDPWIAPLISFLGDVRVQRRPLAGICFGHQVMAQAFGGVAEKAGTGWILGRNRHTLTPAGQTLFGKTALWALSIHQDQVTGVPDGAVRLVGDDFSSNGGLLYLDFPGISVQFHPEFGPEYLSDLIGVVAELSPLGFTT